VPEVARLDVAVALCSASQDALDRLVAPGLGSRSLRVAPDELLVISEPGLGADVRRELHDRLPALDADAIVMDASDGWSGWSLAGPDARAAFARLSWLELPADDGWTQGDVARTAAKVWVEGGTISVLVPAYWDEHLASLLQVDEEAEG
jgi:sarcosine oxidase gamma subunit